MKLHLNKIHYPVTALGPGTRLGIWTQGCTIGCRGCASRDTWQADPVYAVDVDDVLTRCVELVGSGPLDGITISGGEPSDQAAAVIALLERLADWSSFRGDPVDVLLYSGRTQRWLESERPELLAAVDAVIPEPYLDDRRVGGIWRGSANQPIVAFSALGRARYGSIPKKEPAAPPFQIAVADGAVWFIGIPRRGDLDRVVERAATRGVLIGEASWRS